MKKFSVISIFICSFIGSFAQQTMIIQPDGDCGKDAIIGHCVPCGYASSNFGDSDEFDALAWTHNGIPSNIRSFIQFDLSPVPVGSIIENAVFHLYYNPSANQGPSEHSSTSGSNEASVLKVVESWDEHTLTWNNQPATAATSEIYLPASTSGTQDYTITVTDFVQEWVNNPQENFGMMLRLLTEEYYRCLLFASSDHADPALHPKLEVTYTTPDTSCVRFQHGSCPGTDAIIGHCVPCGYADSNFGSSQELDLIAWTHEGFPSNVRSLLYWDFNEIPQNAIVSSAHLSLFYNPTAGQGFPGHMGDNEATILRITGDWDENLVTWNNQPATTTENAVSLPASTSETQDYLDIEITALIQDMISSPSTNFGLMLRLNTESVFRGLLFASSDHPDVTIHPRLDICYTLDPGSATSNVSPLKPKVYPNPSQGSLNVSIGENVGRVQINIYNELGIKIHSTFFSGTVTPLHLNMNSGLYLVQVTNGLESWTEKVIVH